MATRLYVGNLPYSTTEQELTGLFSQAGTVASVKIILDFATGRSKGFGFVEMASESEAQQAIAMMNGRRLQNRNLVVSEARPPKAMGDSPRGGRPARGPRPPREEH